MRWGRGTGGNWGGWGMQKISFKGGQPKKCGVWTGGGVPKKLPLNLIVTAFVIMQTSVPECQKISVSKVLKIQNYPGEHASRPLLYYTPNGNSTPPTVSLQRSQVMLMSFFLASAVLFSNDWTTDNSVQNTVNSRLADTSLLRTPCYYGQELMSRGIRITENFSRCDGLSLLRTPNRGPDGVRYNESWL